MSDDGESVLIVPRCHCAGCRRPLKWDGEVSKDSTIELVCVNQACRSNKTPLTVRVFAARATKALSTGTGVKA